MKSETSLLEIRKIQELGVQFQFNSEVSSLTQLLEKYDAVFLGSGLGPDSRPAMPGSNHPRILGAVDFISQLKTRAESELNWLFKVQTALVIGGGNTALDACRELKKLGIPHVIVSYRRSEAEMSGYLHELKCARQEGVEFVFHSVPSEFKPNGPDRLIVPLKSFRASGSTSDDDSELHAPFINQLDAQLVLFATGQSKLESLLKEVRELKFEKGRLLVDPKTGRTGHPRIFAGGDLTNGGMEVVNAVAEGKRAAQGIAKCLN